MVRLTRTCTQVSMRTEARGMLPHGFDALRWFPRPFWGPKHRLWFSFWHARIGSFHVPIHRNQCPSASAVSGAPGEPRKGAAHASRSELCFALVWMLAKNVPVATRSKSARLQVSASPSVTFDRTVKFVRVQIFADNMRASRLQAKGQRRHLSHNVGPAVAGSAGPVPPPL